MRVSRANTVGIWVAFFQRVTAMIVRTGPGIRPPIEVEGMGREEGRLFLDRLEKHCLSPEFRYDHAHAPGDVTICRTKPLSKLFLR